jgi:hypothetical protein
MFLDYSFNNVQFWGEKMSIIFGKISLYSFIYI